MPILLFLFLGILKSACYKCETLEAEFAETSDDRLAKMIPDDVTRRRIHQEKMTLPLRTVRRANGLYARAEQAHNQTARQLVLQQAKVGVTIFLYILFH